MSNADRISNVYQVDFHPVSHYDCPDEVLQDPALSTAERRSILSSWASDLFAVESNPAFRKIPGVAQPMRLSDILAALRKLDVDDGSGDPPRRGGAAMRTWRPISLHAVARENIFTAGSGRPARRRSWSQIRRGTDRHDRDFWRPACLNQIPTSVNMITSNLRGAA